MRYNLVTLGCAKNTVDSMRLERALRHARHSSVVAPEDADLILVNTCGFIDAAKDESVGVIAELDRARRPDQRLYVLGCLTQIAEDEVRAAVPAVDATFGVEAWDAVAASLGPAIESYDIVQPPALQLGPSAYLKVSDGCDRPCTFCIIPFGRGNSRSVPAGVVVDQIKRLVQQGYNEIVLTGVDLTSWGADLPATPRLGDLVLRILKLVPDLPRLRISSIDSIEADDALMQAIATEPRLMPHLHLSLQAGDDMILKRMKRRHLRDDAIRFAQEARKLRPDMTFGADIIAGFPTETDAMFENSLKLVTDCDLTWLHVFPYSAREGTPAARMPAVNGTLIKERAAQLRAAGDAQVARHLAAQQGRAHQVLMESPTMGRTEQFTETHFTTPQTEGAIISATITGQNAGHLLAV